MMLDDDHLGMRKLVAQSHVQLRFRAARDRTHDRDAIDLITGRFGQPQTFFNSGLRKSAWPLPARHLRFFHRRQHFTVLQKRASRVVEQTSQTKDDHFDFFSILPHVSRSATVRLNTGFSGVESLSVQKYPRRSN